MRVVEQIVDEKISLLVVIIRVVIRCITIRAHRDNNFWGSWSRSQGHWERLVSNKCNGQQWAYAEAKLMYKWFRTIRSVKLAPSVWSQEYKRKISLPGIWKNSVWVFNYDRSSGAWLFPETSVKRADKWGTQEVSKSRMLNVKDRSPPCRPRL